MEGRPADTTGAAGSPKGNTAIFWMRVEARAGIEPACKDLQSSA